MRLQKNSTRFLSVCYLWNVVPKECSTHIRGGSFGMRCMYTVCALSSPTDGRQQTGGRGERLVVRKAVNMAAERTVIGGPATRNLTRRRSPIFFSFYLVWRLLWSAMLLNYSIEVDGFVWYNHSDAEALGYQKHGEIVLWWRHSRQLF